MDKQPKIQNLPTFDTIEQIMADKYLHKCITKALDQILEDRKRVSENGKIKLKRNAVNFLMDMNKFNAISIADEYVHIYYKRSVLSSAIREFISFIVVDSVDKTFKHYEILSQKQNKKNL